jgi:phosphatidylserine/phosphatidylglycerophosphate/cardiolipin synthase-like enzyme
VASFGSPIAGDLADLVAEPPRRGLLDDTDHRAAMISRFSVSGGGLLTAVAPIRSFARPVEIKIDLGDEAVPTGSERYRFVQLNPLPSPAQAAGVMRVLGDSGATMPTFFLGGPGLDEMTPSGTVPVSGLVVEGAAVFVGATLGPCALAPREWARVLLHAMIEAGEPDVGSWAAFAEALDDGPRALYVLRHTGQPPAPGGMIFDVELPGGGTEFVTVDERGDLAAVAPGDVFAPGARVRLRTLGGAAYHTAYDSDLRSSAEPLAAESERWFEPSRFGDGSGTLLCTDLDGWFAERPSGVTLPRYYTGNRVEPLLDGIETFTRMWDDFQPLRNPAGALTAPDGTPYGAWLACWTFEDFELVPGEPASRFVALVEELHRDGTGYQVRLLASKLVQFRGTESQEERLLLVVAFTLAIGGIGGGSALLEAFDRGGSAELWVITHLAAILVVMAASTQFVDAITDALDGSKKVLEELRPAQAATPRIALPSRYPARFSDNPTSDGLPATLLTALAAVEHVGVWHNKMQMLALPGPAGATAPTFVAYLGGVDFNDNRVDTWGHRWPEDYHDVQARLTGPAVADLFQTFYDRWEFDTPRLVGDEGPAAANSCPRVRPNPGDPPTPGLSAIAPTGDDIVQIARTLYRPAAGNAGEAFPFAPDGEATVHDSMLRAIRSAEEYIYIEDQFMVPPDSAHQGPELIEALEEAAQRCTALILVFPEGTGDPQWLFGIERRNMLMARLNAAWAGRLFLPLIRTRPLLGPADRISARGRTVLVNAIDHADSQIVVADGVRVPDTPCWAWIEGELVLVRTTSLDTISGEATLELTRAHSGHHADAWAREHAAGAPVTFTTLADVFIHAKVLLVDDVYASIGSVNMNRRSLFHDGEISAQIVPGRLRAAADNPVRSLRCRIWGDHLGLPPEAAEAELADPLAALPLFRRPRAAGNPLVPFVLLDDMQPSGLAVATESALQILGTIIGGLGQLAGDLQRAALWRTVIDPTTALDPYHQAEPFG